MLRYDISEFLLGDFDEPGLKAALFDYYNNLEDLTLCQFSPESHVVARHMCLLFLGEQLVADFRASPRRFRPSLLKLVGFLEANPVVNFKSPLSFGSTP